MEGRDEELGNFLTFLRFKGVKNNLWCFIRLGEECEIWRFLEVWVFLMIFRIILYKVWFVTFFNTLKFISFVKGNVKRLG